MAEIICIHSTPEAGYHAYRITEPATQVFVADAEIDTASIAHRRAQWDRAEDARAVQAKLDGQPFADNDPGTILPTSNVDERKRIAAELAAPKLNALVKGKGKGKGDDTPAPPAP